MATHGEKRWPPAGRFNGRLRGAFHGHRHCGSARHSTSPRVTSIRRAALSSFARARAGRRREVGMDRWRGLSWSHGWISGAGSLSARCCASSMGYRRPALAGSSLQLASSSGARRRQRRVRRRFAPHQLRHAHAVEMAHEGVPLVVIQRQLGHANLGITSIYLQGIDSSEIIDTVHSRPAPVISATAGLRTRL